MMPCWGFVYAAPGFMIPQLEDPVNGFGITKEEGSWFGSTMTTYNVFC